MSLNLDPECLQSLAERLSRSLEQVRVLNGSYLDTDSVLPLIDPEKALPQHGPIRRALDQYIGDTPFFDFVFGVLASELEDTQKYAPESQSVMLSEIQGFNDLTSVADRLVSQFNSLPWEYTLSVEWPREVGTILATTIGNASLSETERIVTPDDGFSEEYPLNNDSVATLGVHHLLAPPIHRQWQRETSYLQVHMKGFVRDFGVTAPLDFALARVKAICGLAIALMLFKVKKSYRSAPKKTECRIHRRVTNKWTESHTYEMIGPESDTFHDLEFSDFSRDIRSDAERVSWLQKVILSISTVLSNQDRSHRIILAGQWLFESYCGSDELLSFVQTAVVMEILLGDKAASKEIGLSELLANRCAYLISSTQKERNELLNGFKEIYGVRSSIVHAGKKRLSMQERFLLEKLRWMCRRVIQEEVSLLEKEFEAGK